MAIIEVKVEITPEEKEQFIGELALPEFSCTDVCLYEIYNKKNDDHDLLTATYRTLRKYTVVPKENDYICPKCKSNNFTKYGSKNRNAKDLIGYDQLAEIKVLGNRYKCHTCNKVFTPIYKSIDKNGKITKRLGHAIESKIVSSGVSDTAKTFNVSTTTVKKIEKKYYEEQSKSWGKYIPDFPGIAEISFGSRKRFVIIDYDAPGILDILPDTSISTLSNYYKDIEYNREEPGFIIGFNEQLKIFLYGLYSGCSVAVDWYYIKKGIGEAYVRDLGKVGNKSLRDALLKRKNNLKEEDKALLNKCFKNNQRLKNLYSIKEELYDLEQYLDTYSGSTKALNAYKKIREKISKEQYPGFYSLTNKIEEFKTEVFNFFIFPVRFNYALSSAYNLINESNKKYAGFSFESMRSRTLYGPLKQFKTRLRMLPIRYASFITGESIESSDSNISLGENNDYEEVIVGAYADLYDYINFDDDES